MTAFNGHKRMTRRAGFALSAAIACALVSAPAFAQTVDPEVQAETPWYETFSLQLDEQQQTDLVAGEITTFDWASRDGRWEFTLDLEDDPTSSFAYDDLSAEAFVNLNDRFRLGGRLRWTAPEDMVVGAEPEERAPEVRFESALRF